MDVRTSKAPRGPEPIPAEGPLGSVLMWAQARLRWRWTVAASVIVWVWLAAGTTAGAGGIPVAEDGEGIKMGQRSTFHPGFALVTGLDSNVFYAAPQEGARAAAFLSPTAWLGVGNRQVRDGLLMKPPERSARLADYSIRLAGNFRQYLAADELVRQQTRISGGLTMRLAILPGRRFEIDLDEDVYRYAQPSNFEAGGNFNFNRIDHRGMLRFIGRPGGGRVSLSAGFRNEVLRFENNTERDIFANNRTVNGTQTEVKWRFLPKSSLFFAYDFAWTFYLDCCAEVGRGRNEDSFAHRITGGFRGQLLRKLALDATVGWGLGFYRDDENGPNFGSFIGNLGLDYFPTLRTNLHISGYRAFQDSLLGNYFVDNGVRVAAKHQWRWRMTSALGLGVAGRRYAGLPVPGLEDEDIEDYIGSGADVFRRQDVLFTLNAKLEQPVKRIWSFGLQYDLVVDSSDFVTVFVQQPEDLSAPLDVGGFSKHVIMLLAAIRL